jgi:hypothetical protein
VQKIETALSDAKRKDIYIYTTSKFLALQGAPYIHDISRLTVNPVHNLTNSLCMTRTFTIPARCFGSLISDYPATIFSVSATFYPAGNISHP